MNRIRRHDAIVVLTGLVALTWGMVPTAFSMARGDEGAGPRPHAALEPSPRLDVDDDRRSRIPSAEEQKRAVSKVREIFADDYAAAKTPADKQRLAAALLDESHKTREATDAWALMCEAIRTAADAGEVDLTLEMVDALAARYQVDQAGIRMDALMSLAEKASPQSTEAVARHLLAAAGSDARMDGKIRTKALQLAAAMARKAKSPQLIALITQTQARIRRDEAAEKELTQAMTRLKESPDDPKICLEAGSLLCFNRGDWKSGLPLLARGSDPELAALARSDFAAGDATQLVVAAADGWLRWAEGQKAAVKEGAELHAKELYARVVGKLEGLERTRVQKRMASITTTSAASPARVKDGPRSIPGLVLWLDASDPSAFAADGGPKRANLDRVATWKDLSGLGNDALQPDPTKQPRRLAAAVEFGGNEFLSLARPLPGAAVTVLAVYKSTKDTADTTLASTRTASSGGWMVDHQAGSVWFRGFGESGMAQVSMSPPSTDGMRVLLACMEESGRMGLQLAGARPATADKKVNIGQSNTPLAVGGKTGDAGGSHFRGALQRLVIFSRSLSEAEATALLAWNSKNMPP